MWELPNPFLNEQGEPVPKEDWEKQRTYLRKILTDDFYGELPPSPGNVQAEKEFEKELWGGTALFEVYDLSFGPEESVHEKTAVIRPKEGTAKPIVFCGGYVDEEIAKMAVSRGFLIATPLTDDAAPDEPNFEKGTLHQAYPEYSFRAIAMWGWLLSRVMDFLEMTDFISTKEFTVAGHSRYGKAALACAVYEERASVVIAAGSGCGGMGSLRAWGSRFGSETGAVETLGSMLKDNFPHWFLPALQAYGADEPSAHARENELRFDANFIGSVIAPRPLLILEGLDDTWANPYGTVASWSAVSEVYRFLGAEKDCAIHFREGGHALNLSDWKVLLDFAESRLAGEDTPGDWHTLQKTDAPIARSWSAPMSAEEYAADDQDRAAMRARFLKSLENRWAFGEAGLETGMVKYLKKLLKEQ